MESTKKKSADTDIILCFGKHRGKHLSDIDVKYLDYIMGTDWISDDLVDVIYAHLQTRPEWQNM